MASGFNISTFKERGLTLGGARPALFEVFLNNPPVPGIVPVSFDKFRFTCKAAQLPAATVSPVEIGYFGRKIKVAGDRTFGDWAVTVLNDEDFLVRSMFEKWSNALNRLESNVRAESVAEESYKVDMEVRQYDKQGSIIRAYTIIGAFPTTIDAITLDWDATNQIEQFNVTFSYDYWLPAFEGVNEYFAEAITPISS